MKKVIVIFIIGLILVSFKNEKNKRDNFSLIGTYEFKTENKIENHFIVIDTLNGKLVGKYYGTENGSGHGIFFYENEMKNLSIIENTIRFEIEQRKLFVKTRFKIVKQKNKNEESVGLSKTTINYQGKILKDGFEFKCESKYEDCWQKEMIFTKTANIKTLN